MPSLVAPTPPRPAAHPQPPAPPPDPASLPHALTFFLNAGERERALAALRRIHRDRTEALRRALRLDSGPRPRAARAGKQVRP